MPCHQGQVPVTLRIGQSYADDLLRLAVSGVSMQRIINAMHAHSVRWQWDANVTQSHVTVCNPELNMSAQGMADCPVQPIVARPVLMSTDTSFYVRMELSVQRSAKYLDIEFNDDNTWTLQAMKAQAKGCRAFHKWRPTFDHPHLC
jgi:hypothetical protein